MNLEHICQQVIALSKEVGGFLLQESKNFDLANIEYKGAKDLVSYVDREAETKLVAGLEKILPDAGFLTEEGTVSKQNNNLYWVVDPLDGTTNFLHSLPVFSTSIGLMHNGEVVLGVVYEPNKDECFWATKGNGAYLNNKKISVSKVDSLSKALIGTGFPYSLLDRGPRYFDLMRELQEQSHGMRRLGSAAVDLAYVACGRFDAYYEFNLKPWDIAAGILLVQEAGGKISDFEGGNDYISGKEIVAGNNLVQHEIRDIILSHWI